MPDSPKSDPAAEPTLRSSNLAGWPFWRQLVRQYHACYFTSLHTTLSNAAVPLTLSGFGVVLVLGTLLLDEYFPAWASRCTAGFWTLLMGFSFSVLFQLLYLPIAAPLAPPRDAGSRFTLRTLLMVVTVFGVVAGASTFICRQSQRVEDHRATIQRELQSYGSVFYVKFWPLRSNLFELRLSGANDRSADFLSALPEAEKIIVLDIRGSLTDEGLAALQKLEHLQDLWLLGAVVTDDSLREFKDARPDCRVHH